MLFVHSKTLCSYIQIRGEEDQGRVLPLVHKFNVDSLNNLWKTILGAYILYSDYEIGSKLFWE